MKIRFENSFLKSYVNVFKAFWYSKLMIIENIEIISSNQKNKTKRMWRNWKLVILALQSRNILQKLFLRIRRFGLYRKGSDSWRCGRCYYLISFIHMEHVDVRHYTLEDNDEAEEVQEPKFLFRLENKQFSSNFTIKYIVFIYRTSRIKVMHAKILLSVTDSNRRRHNLYPT